MLRRKVILKHWKEKHGEFINNLKQSYSLLHYSKMKGKCKEIDGPHAIILAADSSLVNYALFKTEIII